MKATGLFAIVVAAGCGTALGDRSTLDGVPKAAAAALRARAGDATIEEVGREHHGGADAYEATWHTDGMVREAKVTADGTLVELEEEVRATDVPAVVREAALRALPQGAKYTYLRLLGDRWEVEARIGGVEHDVVVSATGEILGGEVEGEDDVDDEDDDD